MEWKLGICPICGEGIGKPLGRNGYERVYCSVRCKLKMIKRRFAIVRKMGKGGYRDVRDGVWVRVCGFCGRDVMGRGRCDFCDDDCRRAAKGGYKEGAHRVIGWCEECGGVVRGGKAICGSVCVRRRDARRGRLFSGVEFRKCKRCKKPFRSRGGWWWLCKGNWCSEARNALKVLRKEKKPRAPRKPGTHYDRNAAKILEFQRVRRKMDKNYRIKAGLRRRLRVFLDGVRLESSEELFGCDWGHMVRHLEGQFEAGMKWENYGAEWHIDHIMPLSWFDLRDESQRKAACHWSNLQPLWAKENLSKGNSLVPCQPELLLKMASMGNP